MKICHVNSRSNFNCEPLGYLGCVMQKAAIVQFNFMMETMEEGSKDAKATCSLALDVLHFFLWPAGATNRVPVSDPLQYNSLVG